MLPTAGLPSPPPVIAQVFAQVVRLVLLLKFGAAGAANSTKNAKKCKSCRSRVSLLRTHEHDGTVH